MPPPPLPPPPPQLPINTAQSIQPPIPVPTLGATGGVFSVGCSTAIAAPALACLEKVMDVSGYGAWNTFATSASVIAPAPAPAPVVQEGEGEEIGELVRKLKDKENGKGVVVPGARVRLNVVMNPPPPPKDKDTSGKGKGASTRAVDLEVTVLESFTEQAEGDDSGSNNTGAGKRKGKGYRIAWKSTEFPGFLLRAERVQEFVQVGGGEEEGEKKKGQVLTHYRCWETFGGILSYLVPRSQLEHAFVRWMESLKAVVEAEYAASSLPSSSSPATTVPVSA
ncbi:hypothetical protein F5Y17DRAFT_447252 [Xylariaceae sp. FL0594]|nr:hypothetical protein F5Y17DRAFT_447252 [Xylariaceae sp. FL0594]